MKYIKVFNQGIIIQAFYHKIINMRFAVQSKFHKGSLQFTWSFPLIMNINGYAQFFTGYGQTLLEYNQQTRGIGLGIVLNDWI